ncbi:MAG: integrase core domain-containing protein, partial [Planctomycetaceae bacterium]|nr:integrase core domain-containing protein [Planctomycetaceae bacterium]
PQRQRPGVHRHGDQTMARPSRCADAVYRAGRSLGERLRGEFLAMEEFESLLAARRLTVSWREDYNENRPHSSLGYTTPAEFATRRAPSVRPTASLQQHGGNYPTRPS